MENPITTCKFVLVGNGGVGKSTFVKRIRGAPFDGKYIATFGVDVIPIMFQTNHGTICANIWDCAGQEKFGGLRDEYYIDAQGAIVMFDATSKLSFVHAKKWAADVIRVAENIPTVFVANKCDISEVSFPCDVRVSSKNSTLEELRMPILSLLRRLTGHEDLVFM